VLINLRAEPVLFLRRDNDMIPYVASTSDRRVYSVTRQAQTVADIEVALRREASRAVCCLLTDYYSA